MNCDRQALIAFALGDLDESTARQVEEHIQSCSDCARYAAELRQTLDLVATLPEAEQRPVAIESLRAEVAAEVDSVKPENLTPARPTPRWRWVFAAAAVMVLGFLGFHYGVTVRVGEVEIAFGGPDRAAVVPGADLPQEAKSPALEEARIRRVAREEIATEIAPALGRLAELIRDLDTRHSGYLVALYDEFARMRAADYDELSRNMRLIANAMDERLAISP
jgi:hypothetical protein